MRLKNKNKINRSDITQIFYELTIYSYTMNSKWLDDYLSWFLIFIKNVHLIFNLYKLFTKDKKKRKKRGFEKLKKGKMFL